LHYCTRFQVQSGGMQCFASTTSTAFCSNMPKLRSLIAHSPHDLGALIHVPNELVQGLMSHQSYQSIAGSTPASTRSRPNRRRCSRALTHPQVEGLYHPVSSLLISNACDASLPSIICPNPPLQGKLLSRFTLPPGLAQLTALIHTPLRSALSGIFFARTPRIVQPSS
jgi:hypothetical protein